MAIDQNYQRALEFFRNEIPNLKTNEWLSKIQSSRKNVLQHYGKIFSSGNVDKITKEDIHEFLHFDNNCHWTSLVRQKTNVTQDMEALRAGLKKLFDSSLSVPERYDHANKVKYLGPNIITAILQVHSPQQFGVWNDPSEKSLQYLSIYPTVRRGESEGSKYQAINNRLLQLADDLDVSLWTLDTLVWSFCITDNDRYIWTDYGKHGLQFKKALSKAEEEGFYDPDPTDERERRIQAICYRQGQPAFRSELIGAYKGRCSITGCNLVAALHAAHIRPYSGPKSNHVQNGLLLRADIHTLFDLNLFGVDPDTLKVVVTEPLKKSVYSELEEKKLTLPKDRNKWPSKDSLEERWTDFKMKLWQEAL